MKKRFIAFFVALALLLSGAALAASYDGLTEHLLEVNNFDSLQQWLDSGDVNDWCVLALMQSDSDLNFAKFAEKLDAESEYSEKEPLSTREKRALILSGLGKGDHEYVINTLNAVNVDGGIMELVFGVHLINNGLVCQNASIDGLINAIIAKQLPEGGWAITGTNPDPDVTAIVLQAIAGYADENTINAALKWLAQAQTTEGDYMSYGTANCESACQVLIALCTLGIDPNNDERFIKNGNTLLNVIEKYSVGGGYSHTVGGSESAMADSQALLAFAALDRFKNGKGDIFDLDDVELNKKTDYKTYVYALVAGLFIVFLTILLITKKLNGKNLIFGVIIAALLCAGNYFIKLSSPEDYYGSIKEKTGDIVGSVSVSIKCDTVKDEEGKDTILDTSRFDICSGDTAADILKEAARLYGIQLDYEGDALCYVKGIDNIYEMQYGELSGWVYHVNKKEPSVGCGEYALNDGDVIEWIYSLELGQDVKEEK